VLNHVDDSSNPTRQKVSSMTSDILAVATRSFETNIVQTGGTEDVHKTTSECNK
jgi:hypothetical protein